MRYTLVLISAILFSCSNSKQSFNYTNYIIDPDCHLENSFENFMNIKEVIELETNKESLIKSINRIIIKDSLIYIFQRKRDIKVFDRVGKFRNSIGKKGKGPGELVAPYDFDLSPDGKKVAIWDRDGCKISFYTPSGHFIKSVANIKINYGFGFCWAKENDLLFSSMYRKQEAGCFQAYRTDTLLTDFEGIVPYDERFEDISISGQALNKKENGDVILRHHIESEVYNVTAEPKLESKLDFGIDYLPEERKLEYVSNKMLFGEDAMNSNFTLLIKYFEGDNWIYGFYLKNGEKYSIIINKDSNKQKKYKHYTSTDYLSDVAIIGNSSNQLIGRIEPYKLKERISQMSNKEKEEFRRKVPLLYDLMAGKDIADNPILVFMTPNLKK